MKWSESTRRSGTTREGKEVHTVEHSAPGLMGKNYKTSNAIEIEAGWNFSGSGPGSFGGASHWPVAKLHVAFQMGEDKRRDEFVEALKVFTAKFFKS